MSITLICKHCSNSFTTPPSRPDAQFCSYDCRRNWNAAQGKRPVKQTCQQCGKEFTSHASAERRYCSKKCYWKSKEKTEQRICPICQKIFEVWPSEPNRFCSRSCRDVWQTNKEERFCKQCGKAFIVYPHQTNIYCSLKCAAQGINSKRKVVYPLRVCVKCGKEFPYKYWRSTGKYCSRECSDAVNKNAPAQEWISKPCAYCGNLFLCPPWHQQIAHCSNKCASLHQAQTMRGPNHPLWKDRVEMACKVCGKVCMVRPCIVKRFGACSRRCGAVLSALSQQGRASGIERKIQEALRYVGLYPIPQYVIGPYVVDFAIPECQLVIECDGDYWHTLPKQQIKDKRKDMYLKHEGWRVLRLWEHSIRNDINGCLQEVISSLDTA